MPIIAANGSNSASPPKQRCLGIVGIRWFAIAFNDGGFCVQLVDLGDKVGFLLE
jgi:hypothetical protein